MIFLYVYDNTNTFCFKNTTSEKSPCKPLFCEACLMQCFLADIEFFMHFFLEKLSLHTRVFLHWELHNSIKMSYFRVLQIT
jgi:hypothetical protein